MRTARLWLVFLAASSVPVSGRAQFLETTVQVGQGPIDVLWNPTSNRVYTANSLDNTVTIIDGATNQVRATLAVGDFPGELCWNSVENKVYCLCPEANIVEVIDGLGDSIMARVQVEDYPSHAAFSATENKLYVSRTDAGSLVVIDGSADTVLRQIPVARDGAITMLWHPRSGRLFCAMGDSVSVVDCTTDEVVFGWSVRSSAWIWCFNPANGLAYLGGTTSSYVFSPGGDSQMATIPGYVAALCAVPYPNKLYLYGWHLRYRLAVLDCSSHSVVESIAVYGGPMVCDTVRDKVYTSHDGLRRVTVLDARADSVLVTLQLQATAAGALCWNQTDSRVYVADEMGDAVFVLRDTTTGIAETRPLVASLRGRACAFVRDAFCWSESKLGQVIDAGGRRVAEVRPGLNDLGRLPAGIYVVVGADGSPTTRFLKLR